MSDKGSNQPQQDHLSRFIGISLIAHVCLVLAFTVKAVFFPSEQIDIRNSIRVDMVALPDKVQPKAPSAPKPKVEVKKEKPPAPKPKPQAKPKPKPKPKPVVKAKPKAKPKPKPKKKVDMKKAKEEQQKALERLKALQALENIEEEVEKSKQEPQEQQFKGNVKNAGNSLSGLAKIQMDRYFQDLKSHMYQSWSLPQWLSDANLRAQAMVMIDEGGFVVKKQIVQSSGNDLFDNHVLDAIEKASPFPAPPGKLQNMLKYNGLTFNFPE